MPTPKKKPPTKKKPTPPKKPAAAKKKPAPKKPATKKPAAKKPAAKKRPAAPKSAAKKKPAIPQKKPAVKKPAAKNPAPKPAAPERVYTLDELVKEAGTATEADALLWVGELDRAQLTELGRTVATPRISIEAARIYGQAWDVAQAATPTQREALFGLSETLLRTAIWSAAEGHRRFESRGRGTTEEQLRQAQRRSESTALVAKGRATVDGFYAALDLIIARQPALYPRLEAAYTKAEDTGTLGESLRRLAGVGQQVLDSRDAGVTARRTAAGLSAARLQEVLALGQRLVELGAAAAATRSVAPVSQGEVDYWDGINLTLLRRIVYLFDAAHLIDPSIPRLVPISLHTIFYGRSTKPAAPTTPSTPSPATP